MNHIERRVREQKDDAILVLLGKLALIYWRPDMSPAQARELYTQYLEDLREFPFSSIKRAVEDYRRNGENKFFPAPGQLRDLITTVPAWDIISAKKHRENLRIEAREEIEETTLLLSSKMQSEPSLIANGTAR